jgi:hypothetical protein
MSLRIDPTWVVFRSIEDASRERCVDLFERPDGTFGFEEFRRDFEDQGRWTATQYYSGKSYASREAAWAAAKGVVLWLT